MLCYAVTPTSTGALVYHHAVEACEFARALVAIAIALVTIALTVNRCARRCACAPTRLARAITTIVQLCGRTFDGAVGAAERVLWTTAGVRAHPCGVGGVPLVRIEFWDGTRVVKVVNNHLEQLARCAEDIALPYAVDHAPQRV